MLGIALSKRIIERWIWLVLLIMITILIWMDHEHSLYIRMHQHPCHVEDCVAALTYIKQHAHEYHASVDEIHVMGHSAGAHLASLLLIHPKYTHVFDRCSIRSAILISGVYDGDLFLSNSASRSFIRYVFGHDHIPSAFPLAILSKRSDFLQDTSHCRLRHVRWLIMHGEFEYGLDQHSSRLVEALQQVYTKHGDPDENVEYIAWSSVDHFSIIDQWSTYLYCIPDTIEKFARFHMQRMCNMSCNETNTV
jgi:acetyl esterase/lipase